MAVIQQDRTDFFGQGGAAGFPRPYHSVIVGLQPATEAIHHRGFTGAFPAFNGNELALHQFPLINLFTAFLCSCSVAEKVCPPVPSATK